MELTGRPVGVLAEAALERGGLVPVVLLGARAVRVDVVDRRRVQPGLVERDPDRLGHLPAVGPQPGHVVGVAARGVTGDLGVDVRAAAPGALAAPPGRSTAAPSPSTKPLRVRSNGREACSRVVVARRGRLDRVEAGHGDRRDRRVGGAGDHHVGGALADQLDGVADRVEAGGAAGGDHASPGPRRRPPRPPRRRTSSARSSRTGAGRRSVWSTRSSRPPSLTTRYSWSRPIVAPTALPRVTPMRCGSRSAESEAAVGDRLARGDHGELRGPVHPPDLLRAQAVRRRVEVDLGGDPGAERRRVEEGDPPGRGAAVAEQVPEVLGADPAGREHADAGDDDSPPCVTPAIASQW